MREYLAPFYTHFPEGKDWVFIEVVSLKTGGVVFRGWGRKSEIYPDWKDAGLEAVEKEENT